MNHEFYITLTPTITSTLSLTKYEKLMSDFETQLRKPITLTPNMKWRAQPSLRTFHCCSLTMHC